jgi:hypothetical protein
MRLAIAASSLGCVGERRAGAVNTGTARLIEPCRVSKNTRSGTFRQALNYRERGRT